MWVEIGRHQFDLAKVRHVERCVRLDHGLASLVVHLADGRDVDLTVADAAVFVAVFREFSAVSPVKPGEPPGAFPGTMEPPSTGLGPNQAVGVEEPCLGHGDAPPDPKAADIPLIHNASA